ncbi:MAG: 3-dehydroquinate synthase [Chloroflexi bacterium]|nr:3-dehydroquinate synthase [Chloroflexota bacterium]
MKEHISLPVFHPAGQYKIHIGEGLRHRLDAFLADGSFTRRAFLVTDEHVASLYADDVAHSLEQGGYAVHRIVLPPGEAHKTLDTVRQVYEQLVTHGVDRQSPLIALGGGVVGDLAGFAAATILRGIPLVQMPTTLLAMVDASVGGKTGVDLPQGKNLVGAFKFPHAVLADTETLATLPREEVAAGMAETVKHALIADPGLLDVIEAGEYSWPELVARSVQVKIHIVQEDPYEAGRRALLNLGHTFAHALEQVTHYRLRHGFAVALGLVAAAQLGVELGETRPALVRRIKGVLQRVHLPVHWQDMPELGPPPRVEDVLQAMGTDKKRLHGQLRFIIPAEPGHVFLVGRVPEEGIRAALAEILDGE